MHHSRKELKTKKRFVDLLSQKVEGCKEYYLDSTTQNKSLNERIRNSSSPAGNSLSFVQQRELIIMQRRTVLSDALEDYNANYASGFTRLEKLDFSEDLITRPVLAEIYDNFEAVV